MELAKGDVVFRRGERRVPFFLVLEGSIEIVAHVDAGEQVITTHGASQFTGELDLFNDRKILVDGRAAGPTRVVRLERAAFQRMMVAEPDIAEVITRALILRRVGLIRHDQGGVRLVGDAHDGETLSLARFLKRNGYPVRVVPPDTVEGLPDGTALPALQLPQGGLLKQPTRADVAEELGLSEQLKADHLHEVAVVGAGPSGLAAAVYAASEGLDTVVLEQLAPGGAKPGPARASRTTSAFRPGSRARRWRAARRCRLKSSARGWWSAVP
ncbi:MAG: cyclic nucleotide-binding domain-containing protein [Sandaracinaceae bacterium]